MKWRVNILYNMQIFSNLSLYILFNLIRLNLCKMQVRSEKKFSPKLISTLSDSYARNFVYSYENGFQAHTHNGTEVALQYFLGLLKMEKGQGNS